jgi:hypothetical protein
VVHLVEPDRDVEGQTTAITTFSTVRWWGRVFLPILFTTVNHVPFVTKKLRDLSFIDFARWCLIDELPYNGPPQKSGKLRYPHLFFESNFNGGWEEYIDAFSNQLTSGMWSFWGSSYGFPGAKPVGPFKDYIRSNEYEVEHFYVAYDASSTTIQRALKLVGTPETKVNSFMVMCPIQPGMRDELENYLHAMDPGPLARLPRTHMGRFVIIDDFHYDPAWDQPQDEHLDVSYLVFTACIDGDVHSYLDELAGTPEALEIWSRCIGGSHEMRSIKAYLKHNEIKADVFFAAYNATVQEVKKAIEKYPAPDASWVSKTPIVRLHVGRVVDEVAKQYAKQREKYPNTIAKRDQHADEYGTIHGRMTVRVSDVLEDLRHGLFAQDGSYDVICRLSPNAPIPWPLCPPVGLAMKVHDVLTDDGLVDQDLLLGAEVDRFFCRGAEDAVDLVKARAGGMVGLVRYLSTRPLEARIMVKTITRRVGDLLSGTTYFSMLPIHCGPDQLVKVSIRTPSSTPRRIPSLRRPDLGARLRETLKERGVTVVLCLQKMTEDDDPNDPRERSTGPWEIAAEVFFPAQEPGSGEHLSFNPGNCHPAHETFGELFEVRKAVYERVFRLRSAINAARQ